MIRWHGAFDTAAAVSFFITIGCTSGSARLEPHSHPFWRLCVAWRICWGPIKSQRSLRDTWRVNHCENVRRQRVLCKTRDWDLEGNVVLFCLGIVNLCMKHDGMWTKNWCHTSVDHLWVAYSNINPTEVQSMLQRTATSDSLNHGLKIIASAWGLRLKLAG